MKKIGVFNKHTFMRLQKICIFRIITSAAIAILTLLLMVTLMPIYNKPYSAEAATGGAVSPVLTFASTNPVASVNMIVSSSTGTFATSNENEKAAFTISTNNYTGYTVILKSTGTVTNLGDGSSHNISTISSSTTSDVFASNGASGQALNNRWGYLPNYYNATGTNPSVNTTTYYPAPTSVNTATLRTTDVANSTNGVDNADDYTIGLGFRADYNMPSGTYANDTFVLEIVANPVAFVIQYDKNTTDTITNMPANQSGTSAQNHITLSSDTPTRAHYNFLGWCEGEITVTNNAITGAAKDTCTGTNNNIYQPGDDFYFDFTVSNHVNLKAMWEERYYMQDFTTNMCNSMTDAQSLTLYDRRDEQDYTIAKIDEECWMTKNLNLAGGTALYSATSNVPAGYDNTAYYTMPASSSAGFSDHATAYVYNSGNTDCTGDTPCYSYYSYPAATANTNPANGEAEYDICPKNWRLPTITNFNDLINQFPTVSNITSSPWNGNLTGRYESGIFGLENHGRYWSSTAAEVNTTYVNAGFLAYDTVLNQLDTRFDRKRLGFAVRCVLKYPYMQDQTEAAMATVLPNIGDTTILADKRDNTKYMVGRLADNNYWMLKNLALDLTATHLTMLQGNTNASDSTLNYLKNGGGTGQYPASGVSTTWSDSYTLPIINKDSKYTLVTSYGKASTNQNKAKVGTYYNYCAASAGSYCETTTTATGNAMEDVCPSNWRLPNGGQLGEYKNLCNTIKGSVCGNSESMAISSTTGFQYSLNTPLSGYYLNGQASNQNNSGVFWTSTQVRSAVMYHLGATATEVNVQNTSFRDRGLSVRCILKSPIMQDQTVTDMATLLPNNGDSIKMEDKRDHSKYQVTKISGDYWMAQNLRISGTIPSDYSNFTGNSFNVSEYDLETDGESGEACYGTSGGYYNACSKMSDDINIGSWYNFYAASAGTIKNNNDTSVATVDICPIGWRLPTGPNTTSGTDFNKLIGNTTSGWQNITSNFNYFNAVPNGRYLDGQIVGTEYGTWWSATTSGTSQRYKLVYNSNTDQVRGDEGGDGRNNGLAIRCIRETRTILDIDYMQEITPSIAYNTQIGTTTTLRDSRDEQSYTVSKLADGNIWLLDNLALDLTNQTVINNTTSANTNATSTSLNYLKNGGGTASDQYAINGLTKTEWTSSNSYSAPLLNTTYKNTVNTNDTLSAAAKTWKYGIYYNYCAASAGSYCYGDGSNSGTSVGNSTEDICPKGWRMPTGGTSGDYGILYENYNSLESIRNAFHLPLSGWLSNGQSSAQGETGGWFSATRLTNSNMYGIHIESTGVTVTRTPSRVHGNTIRCIVKY